MIIEMKKKLLLIEAKKEMEQKNNKLQNKIKIVNNNIKR